MKPLRIFKAALSGRYYACRAYKQCGYNSTSFEVTGKKEDVTEQISELLQAQHEATWAMAMDAAAKKGEIIASEHTRCEAYIIGEGIRAIPCPPLQTTNEESEK